jgi:hypothetical protein
MSENDQATNGRRPPTQLEPDDLETEREIADTARRGPDEIDGTSTTTSTTRTSRTSPRGSRR